MPADHHSAETASPKRDDDSPWKEALERFFPEFLALLFPAVHAEIDWLQGVQFLDKEFQQLVQEAKTTRRYADKLVGVTQRDGTAVWVLIHVEVQGEAETAFAERMYTPTTTRSATAIRCQWPVLAPTLIHRSLLKLFREHELRLSWIDHTGERIGAGERARVVPGERRTRICGARGQVRGGPTSATCWEGRARRPAGAGKAKRT